MSGCSAPALVALSAAGTPLSAPSAVISCRNRRRLAGLSITDLLLFFDPSNFFHSAEGIETLWRIIGNNQPCGECHRPGRVTVVEARNRKGGFRPVRAQAMRSTQENSILHAVRPYVLTTIR